MPWIKWTRSTKNKTKELKHTMRRIFNANNNNNNDKELNCENVWTWAEQKRSQSNQFWWSTRRTWKHPYQMSSFDQFKRCWELFVRKCVNNDKRYCHHPYLDDSFIDFKSNDNFFFRHTCKQNIDRFHVINYELNFK